MREKTMREKNSERPDTRDNRSKNSTKTGKKKKNTKNQEFAVITYSFLALECRRVDA